ncbi:asparagine synthetase B family protein [Pontibacter roseus]|uniref:hypothetical protein n=1 Tax=Pontibacter roseus TaxID=336989 RepID=UPI00037D2D8B|nr:hypothetical protein [Pontibacter roseus]
MHVWLLKYSKSNLSLLAETKFNTSDIPVLKNFNSYCKEIGDFKLVSYTPVDRTSKAYFVEYPNLILGYSGTILDNSGELTDFRSSEALRSLKSSNEKTISGQFSIFKITNSEFDCHVDCLGHHKVFYTGRGSEIYVSNYLPVLAEVAGLKINVEEYIKQKVIKDTGAEFGYSTVYEGVNMLPEYGHLTIEDGRLKVGTYKSVKEILSPNLSFTDALQATAKEFKNNAKYLRNFHDTVVPLSGGFDSRLVLSMFWNTTGRTLQTLTYNRQSNLDFWIAGILSRKFDIPHVKVLLDPSKDQNLISAFNPQTDGDVFSYLFRLKTSDFYNSGEIKVSLNGNGGDTDWSYKFSKNLNPSATNFTQLVTHFADSVFSKKSLSEDFAQKSKIDLEKYLLSKYNSFENKIDFLKLFCSAVFHLERWRSQGVGISQSSLKYHDSFSPFGSENFLKLVFLSKEENLIRGNKESLHNQLYGLLTENVNPYAPLLGQNEWHEGAKMLVDKSIPLYSKVMWKLQGGDINTQLRVANSIDNKSNYKEIILDNAKSSIWDYFDKNSIVNQISKNQNPNGINLAALAALFNIK